MFSQLSNMTTRIGCRICGSKYCLNKSKLVLLYHIWKFHFCSVFQKLFDNCCVSLFTGCNEGWPAILEKKYETITYLFLRAQPKQPPWGLDLNIICLRAKAKKSPEGLDEAQLSETLTRWKFRHSNKDTSLRFGDTNKDTSLRFRDTNKDTGLMFGYTNKDTSLRFGHTQRHQLEIWRHKQRHQLEV